MYCLNEVSDGARIITVSVLILAFEVIEAYLFVCIDANACSLN